jgi:CMP/dCMP kinase
MAVITISRQYGSGGDEIAARVCELLGYRYFDKGLMAQVAAGAGLSESEVVDFSEAGYKSPNVLNRLLSLLTTPAGQQTSVAQVSSWTRDASGAKVRQVEGVGETRSAAIVRGTIVAAYKLGDVMIVGRGGQAALQDEAGVLHVRVEAPLAVRVQRVARTASVSEREAERLIAERDQASAGYVKRFYGVDASDATLYHLVMNTGKWDLEAAAKVIAGAVGNL